MDLTGPIADTLLGHVAFLQERLFAQAMHGSVPSRFPSPRPGRQPEVVLVHSDAHVRTAIASAAGQHGIRIIQAIDVDSGWAQVANHRACVLVLPVAGIRDGRLPATANLTHLVAILGPLDSAKVALCALRAGACRCIMANDPPAIWIQAIEEAQQQPASAASARGVLSTVSELPTRESWNDLLIEEAVRRSGGQIAAAARLLGMTRQALHQRLSVRSRQDRLTDQAAIQPATEDPSPDSNKVYSSSTAASRNL